MNEDPVPTESENPYAGPQSEDDARPAPLTDLGGRMPGSVKLAIGSLATYLVFNSLLFLVESASSWLGMLAEVAIAVGTAILVGLWRRRSAARGWARVYCAVVATIVGMGVLLMLGTIGSVLADAEYQAAVRQDPNEAATYLMLFRFVLSLVTLLIPFALLAATFVALGRATARNYFGVLCPLCHGKRVTAVNRSPDHLHCSGCGHEWDGTLVADQPAT